MKTTKKQFELFKSECQKWLERFQIDDFEVRVFWGGVEKKENAYECSREKVNAGVIEIFMAKELSGFHLTEKDIKKSAKHEMIHALMAEFSYMAGCRCITDSEMTLCEERLTRKLENIIHF
jgi:hypothetical protein